VISSSQNFLFEVFIWLIIDISSVLVLLHHVDMGYVAEVSEVFLLCYSEDGGSMYVRNIAQIHTV
jgi:hypothetical protein